VLGALAAPLLWMATASLKTNIDVYDADRILVFTPTLQNYVTVFAQQDFLPALLNSAWVGVASTALSLLIAVPAAYSMSRFAMRRSAAVVLLGRMVPAVTLLVPWYYVFSQLGLVGGYEALVLAHMFVSVPLILYIMLSFFDGVPLELEEAAQVDGLTAIGAFARIAVPLARSGMATASILAFIFSWNNFMFALVLSDNDTRTLPVSLFNFISYASIDWGALMAASVAVTVPIMVFALFTQKHIVAGLTSGATKG